MISDDEWFNTPHPHDSMPIATNGSNRYAPPEKMIELQETLEENPRPEEEIADWFDTAPCSVEPQDEEDITIHEKMYRIATDKYNPFSIGGSENIHDFDK